jgi:hypothetical protein
MDQIEGTLGAAISLLILLVITIFLLGLVSRAVRWLWEIWGGRR